MHKNLNWVKTDMLDKNKHANITSLMLLISKRYLRTELQNNNNNKNREGNYRVTDSLSPW